MRDVYLASRTGIPNVIEAYVNNLVFNVPAPPRGLTKVMYEFIAKENQGRILQMYQPPINKLPFVNLSHFRLMMSRVELDDIIIIFTALLLEKRILIVAENIDILVPICLSLHSLIHPFEYSVFVPVLLEKFKIL